MLRELEPANVFTFFEEICQIPHGSGNTEQISNYLAEFAQKRNLEYYQDVLGNVIIIKEATPGYEEHEPVMLQGHMDMVAVKESDCAIDMQKDGLKLAVEGDWLSAEGTSLGGDDGIALAYGLALLDGTEYHHPRIELVFTVDEEVGMDGARALSVSPLKAKRLINLDSEEEGIFLAGCAGGARVNMVLSFERKLKQGTLCKISISGLKGGHSGGEIHKERGNAICILGRVLARLSEKLDLCLVGLEGGVADNAIPISSSVELLVTGHADQEEEKNALSSDECQKLVAEICAETNAMLRGELADKDGDVKIEAAFQDIGKLEVMGEALSKRAIDLLNSLPYGVQAMSSAMPGLVETSLNPGLLRMNDDKIRIGISVRSSIDSAKDALVGKLKSLAYLAGAKAEVTGDYPGWAYRKISPLRDKMVEVYKDLYQKEPVVQAIHAGVECGLLAHKIPGLDCVSIGPDMKDIHTTGEMLSIPSVRRMWEYLLKVLEVL